MNYVDLNSEEFKCDNYKETLRLIKLTGLSLVDAKYLPLLECAFKGNYTAACELADAFTYGKIKGIPANYTWAKLFAETIHNTNMAHVETQPHIAVESYRALGITERKFGKLDAAIECFRDAIKLTANRMKPEDWDFSIHQLLQETLEQKWQIEGHG